jgi:hypothetical protein
MKKLLTGQRVLELKAILERERGITISYEETAEIARGLIRLYRSLAKNNLDIGSTRSRRIK